MILCLCNVFCGGMCSVPEVQPFLLCLYNYFTFSFPGMYLRDYKIKLVQSIFDKDEEEDEVQRQRNGLSFMQAKHLSNRGKKKTSLFM